MDNMQRKIVIDMIRENATQPSFVKYLSRGENWKSKSTRCIPEEFEKRKLEGFSDNRVVIKVQWGNSWQVWLQRDRKGLFMVKEDWDEFVDDNLLGPNDILLFTHENTMFLKVKIFKQDGTEIISPPHGSESDPESDPEPDPDPETESELLHPRPQDSHQETTSDPVSGGRARQSSIQVKDRERYMRYLHNPNNPFFVKTLTKRNEVLYVSRPVIKDYNLTFGEKIEYIVPQGKEEGTTRYYSGHPCFAGWAGLCRRYNLKPDDTVVCELEHTNGLVTAVRVHFVNE